MVADSSERLALDLMQANVRRKCRPAPGIFMKVKFNPHIIRIDTTTSRANAPMGCVQSSNFTVALLRFVATQKLEFALKSLDDEIHHQVRAGGVGETRRVCVCAVAASEEKSPQRARDSQLHFMDLITKEELTTNEVTRPRFNVTFKLKTSFALSFVISNECHTLGSSLTRISSDLVCHTFLWSLKLDCQKRERLFKGAFHFLHCITSSWHSGTQWRGLSHTACGFGRRFTRVNRQLFVPVNCFWLLLKAQAGSNLGCFVVFDSLFVFPQIPARLRVVNELVSGC